VLARVRLVICYFPAYSVFNVEQVEDLPAHFYTRAELPADPVERIARAEAFFAATNADIRNGGTHAFFSPIQLCRGETHLIALLRRALLPWAREIIVVTASKRASQLAVQEEWYICFNGSWPDGIRREQSIDGSFDKRPLVSCEEFEVRALHLRWCIGGSILNRH
jgi:hypothetical protein